MTKILNAEPYKLLFILGALCAFVGVGQWILFYTGTIAKYPIQSHSQMMILGFLFSFVSGFLMTAIPRMTGTESATGLEKIIANLIVVVFFVFSLMGRHEITLVVSSALFVFLITYFVRRKLKMKNRPLPAGFIFVPLGLIAGLAGSILLFLSSLGLYQLLGIGRLLLYEGFILNLIIGLGSRLIPVLTQKTGALSPVEINGISNRMFALEALIFNLSFFIEEFENPKLGIAMRFAVMSFIVCKNFRLLKPMGERSKLGFGIAIASASFPLGYFLVLLFPLYRTHIIHFLYISGFAILTLLVSVRVSLAHGGASLDRERTSDFIIAFVGAFLVASLLRVLGPILGGDNVLVLYAGGALFFIFGLVLWGLFLRDTLFIWKNNVEKC